MRESDRGLGSRQAQNGQNVARVALAAGLALCICFPAWATTTSLYSGTGSWEDTVNWSTGAIPRGFSTVDPPNDAEAIIEGSADVTFDADTWSALIADEKLHIDGTTGEYRIETLRVGRDSTNSISFDFGDANTMRMINSRLSYIGSNTGSSGTVNMVSGQVINETSTLAIAEKDASTGLLNISGGTYIVGRESGGNSLNLGTPSAAGTDGTMQISGGTFRTRAGVTLGATGTFDVQGSGVAEIGIGSQGSVDGRWVQATGGLLRAGVDAGGITPILVDEIGDDGGGNASFLSGSLLEPYDLGGAASGVWHTVMTWEGTLVNLGLGLTPASVGAGWEFRINDGAAPNALQVRLTVPEPVSLTMLVAGGGLMVCILGRRR